jgi:hypothetical protein
MSLKVDQIAEELGEAFLANPPEQSPREPKGKGWRPNLGPIGTQVLLNRTDETKFMYGERGSLKTGIAIHDIIRHVYEDFEPGKLTPLAVICTIVRSGATEGGAWEKLHSLYLPEWYDGIGLEFTEPKMDDQKNRYCFIANKAGTWSKVVLKSIPHGESIRARIKGIEPSLFFFDEITEADDPDYYLIPSQALRRPTGGPRFFIAAGNPPPEGTEHWTWKVMCQRQDGFGEDGRPVLSEPIIPRGGGKLEGTPNRIAVYHVPLSENVYWSEEEKENYRAKLMQEARLDPTAEDRLIKGIWTPRPKGHGFFKTYFAPHIHMKPADNVSAVRGFGILPIAGWPLYWGYDLGQVFSSCTLLQRLMRKTKHGDMPLWLVIDEVDHLGYRILYRDLARQVVQRMKHWRTIPLPSHNGKPYPFEFTHITDDSAVTQWRPGDGSFDAFEFEKEFKVFADREGIQPAKMIGCPKPAGSVAVRIMKMQTLLHQEEIYISAQCPNTKGMLLNLEAEKDDADKPRRSKWIHKFDSTTYPIYKLEGPGGRFMVTTGNTQAPSIISCGSGSA